jgi:hypothetical protein
VRQAKKGCCGHLDRAIAERARVETDCAVVVASGYTLVRQKRGDPTKGY